MYNTPNVTYGHTQAGWSFVSSTANSVTLQPADPYVLPQNFKVYPQVNGIQQPPLTCTVTRAPFNTSSSSISVNGSLCPGSIVTVSLNNASNYNSINWSILQPTIATMLSNNGSSFTMQILNSGSLDIVANVVNSCGQTGSITKNVKTGVPYVNPSINSIEGVHDWYASNNNYDTVNAYMTNINASSYQWILSGGPSNCFNKPKFSNGSTTIYTTFPSVTFEHNSCEGTYYLRCKPINYCGAANGMQISFTVGNQADNPCYGNDQPFARFSTKLINPVKDDEIVANIAIDMFPCDIEQSSEFRDSNTTQNLEIPKELLNAEYKVELYDFYGKKVFKNSFYNQNISIKGLELKKGIYIMKIEYPNGKIETQKLVVE